MAESELCFPYLNTSCPKLQRTHSDRIFTNVLLCFISVITAVLNLLVIISISHFKQLHTPTNHLLLSLAISDFFVSFLLSFQIVFIDGCWFFGDLMCALFNFFDYMITSTSVGNMVLISIDRFMAICDPLHYHNKVTQKRVRICICLCWICSFFWISVLLRDNIKHLGKYNSCFGECLIVFSYVEQIADLIITLIIPISVIVILYTQVFVVAMSQARAMRSHIVGVKCKGSKHVKKSELKAAGSLGVVVLVFLICLFPYFCVTLAGEGTSLNIVSATAVSCLFYFNSCLNPLIYAFFYPWFRKSVKFIITFQILQPGTSDANVL